jgi:DNA polymerase-3 subunit gamma/tau
LARKWRPQRFEDVVGQEHVTRTLRNAIESGRIHHAFLFIGSRGIGKTTTARILGKALNCLSSDTPTADPCGVCDNCVSIGKGTNIDVIEIDGASNNGVDDVREIRDHIRMVPTHGRYKIYIIDEVHQLSAPAFNALLKTLEEPPPHGVFILATTEAHKIPATIVSRCQRYDFRRVASPQIVTLLRGICEKEGKRVDDDALRAIAIAAEGGVRDSESILDQLMSYCDEEISLQDVYDMLGLVDRDVLRRLGKAMAEKDIATQLEAVEAVVAAGKDLSQFVQELLQYFRNLVVVKTGANESLLNVPEEERQDLHAHAQHFTLTQLIRLVEQFAELSSGFDSQVAQRIALEALLIRMSKVGVDFSVDTVLERLLHLGHAAPPGTANPPDAGVFSTTRDTAPAPVDTREPVRAPQPAPDPPPAPVAPPPAKPAPAASQEAQDPPVMAPPVRATLNADNLRELWPGVIGMARAGGITTMSVRLALATPIALEDGVVVLEFPAGSTQAKETVDSPEARAEVEAVMAKLFTNATTYRTVFATPRVQEPAAAANYDPDRPYYPGVNPAAAKAALEHPGVAAVVEAFKGRIAEIRLPEPPVETA